MLLSKRFIAIGSLITLIVIGCIIRVAFLGTSTYDMSYFLIPWYDHFQHYGIHGIVNIPSNYNVPYLYLLWANTELPYVTPLVAIKLITLVFEIVFCILTFFIVREYTKDKLLALVSSIAMFFVPTLLLQGGLWGQCDIIYTTFLVAAWWMITKKKHVWSWVFFGVAIAFKLQAIFFLPFMLYIWLTHNKLNKPFFTKANLVLIYPLISIGVMVLLALPALAMGKPIDSIFGIYSGQVNDPSNQARLSTNAVSIYHLFTDPSNSQNLYLAKPSILITAALVLAIITSYILFIKRDKTKEYFILPLLLLVLIPFFLPFMHERYFFAAEIFAFLFAFLLKDRGLFLSAIALQITAITMYSYYLWGSYPWSPKIMSLLQLIVIVYLTYRLMAKKVAGQRKLT